MSGYTHHAEGLVNPKVLAKNPITDLRYPRLPEHVDSENIKLKIGYGIAAAPSTNSKSSNFP
jgi:hypothetical protein